jgi:hypothetical protein
MLTIFQLRHLPLQEQVQYVLDNGEFTVSKKRKDHMANLYWIGSFYAEIIYSDQTNTITEVVFKEANINDYLFL